MKPKCIDLKSIEIYLTQYNIDPSAINSAIRHIQSVFHQIIVHKTISEKLNLGIPRGLLLLSTKY